MVIKPNKKINVVEYVLVCLVSLCKTKENACYLKQSHVIICLWRENLFLLVQAVHIIDYTISYVHVYDSWVKVLGTERGSVIVNI